MITEQRLKALEDDLSRLLAQPHGNAMVQLIRELILFYRSVQ